MLIFPSLTFVHSLYFIYSKFISFAWRSSTIPSNWSINFFMFLEFEWFDFTEWENGFEISSNFLCGDLWSLFCLDGEFVPENKNSLFLAAFLSYWTCTHWFISSIYSVSMSSFSFLRLVLNFLSWEMVSSCLDIMVWYPLTFWSLM